MKELFFILQFGIFHAYEYFVEHQKKLKLEGELRTAALKSELSAIKAQLNPKMFLRVHRSSIININTIKQLDKYSKSYDVTMQNNDVVRVSRGYMPAVKKLIY